MFNEINQRLKDIHTLSNNIDAPKNANTKSAVDLNSRLVAELAYIGVMNLKLQTLISQQLVQTQANELADDSDMIRFNTLPNE
jgi:type IV secretion system protein VirB5